MLFCSGNTKDLPMQEEETGFLQQLLVNTLI